MNLIHGDCLEVMKTLPDNSVDAVVADPPYGLSFMGKKWDYQIPAVEVWIECLRILKPGGHALIACGTRTQHRMVCNIEDAGFEIRDVVSYLYSQHDTFQAFWDSMTDAQRKMYGSIHQDNTVLWGYGVGFPKSLNISKAIDKAAGAEREVVRTETRYNEPSGIVSAGRNERTLIERKITDADAAKQWDGWGTALKPAVEFFTLCRKPISEKTVAANVLKWGTGGINVDGCRVEGESWGNRTPIKMTSKGKKGGGFGQTQWETMDGKTNTGPWKGRFPANLVLSYPEEEYTLRDDVTPDQLRKLAEWME